ncbi:hypothetical protein WICMUC_001423 [Wickerhamomyces mucosus]|uniref:Hap4 transcription factor heteromerisation domain-containing protein n=1 Tax=Wickerhamomyces mucosus TaxID=1378264 RepID=A0A9P8TGW2_9ASCO|nr:hypothetical protein WICMUC_001423 [Wickerhamomyces mucosus]
MPSQPTIINSQTALANPVKANTINNNNIDTLNSNANQNQNQTPNRIPIKSMYSHVSIQPKQLEPKIAPKPIQVLPKPIRQDLNHSNSSNSNHSPCIITSKQWVLPPRPKAGRKPEKKKVKKIVSNSTPSHENSNQIQNSSGSNSGVSLNSGSGPVTNLSDNLTNLNIKTPVGTPAPSVISQTSVSSMLQQSSENNYPVKVSVSKSICTSNKSSKSTKDDKQKKLKSQLESATQENAKLKNIIERLKFEIEELQSSSPSPSVNHNLNFNYDAQQMTQQYSNVKIESSPPMNLQNSMISPTIDPTKIDIFLKEEPKKKRQYKKKKKLPAEQVEKGTRENKETKEIKEAKETKEFRETKVKLEDTPSPLTLHHDLQSSDLPNLSAILEDSESLDNHFEQPLKKTKTLKLERSVSLTNEPSFLGTSIHKTHSIPHHSIGGSLHSSSFPNISRSITNSSLGTNPLLNDWEDDLSRTTTLTTIDWDEEEGRFVDMGNVW